MSQRNSQLYFEKSLEKFDYSEKCRIFAGGINTVNDMSKQEKEEKAKEFWRYYEATQGSITIVDPKVLD
jgi:hypothetical protein